MLWACNKVCTVGELFAIPSQTIFIDALYKRRRYAPWASQAPPGMVRVCTCRDRNNSLFLLMLLKPVQTYEQNYLKKLSGLYIINYSTYFNVPGIKCTHICAHFEFYFLSSPKRSICIQNNPS